MAMFSTGLRTGMLDNTGARTALALGTLRIFSGAVPASADAAETGTLLAELTNNGTATGLTFDPAVAGILSKTAAEVWKDNSNNATGTASYFRFVAVGDTGLLSTTQCRIQGLCGVVASDMIMANTTLTSGNPFTLNYFSVALPTL